MSEQEAFAESGCTKLPKNTIRYYGFYTGRVYKSAYGLITINPSTVITHIWKFKIIKRTKTGPLYIGISSEYGKKDTENNFIENKNSKFYALASNGFKYSQNKRQGMVHDYDHIFGKQDEVQMKLTVEAKLMCLSFKIKQIKQELPWMVAFDKIPTTNTFKMAVALTGDTSDDASELQLIGYERKANLSDIDDEKKNESIVIKQASKSGQNVNLNKMVEDLQNEMLNKINIIQKHEVNTQKLEDKMKELESKISSLQKENKRLRNNAQQTQNQSHQVQQQNDKVRDELERFKQTDLVQKSNIKSLEKELINIKKEEEEKKDEYNKNELGKEIKMDLKHLEQELNEFNDIYDKNNIFKVYNKSAESLLVNDEIDALDLRLRSFGKYLIDIKGYIESLIHPDISKYKQWNIDQIIQWISTLENGRYKKYIQPLKAGFVGDGIDSGDCLPDIDKKDLRDAPFNITDFKDRRDLANHFMSLKTKQMIIGNNNDQNNEGTATDYI